MAKVVVINVEFTSGKTPNLPIDGCQVVVVKKLNKFTSGLLKNNRDSFPSSKTIPKVVNMDIVPQRKRKLWITFSPTLGCFFRSVRVSGVSWLVLNLCDISILAIDNPTQSERDQGWLSVRKPAFSSLID